MGLSGDGSLAQCRSWMPIPARPAPLHHTHPPTHPPTNQPQPKYNRTNTNWSIVNLPDPTPSHPPPRGRPAAAGARHGCFFDPKCMIRWMDGSDGCVMSVCVRATQPLDRSISVNLTQPIASRASTIQLPTHPSAPATAGPAPTTPSSSSDSRRRRIAFWVAVRELEGVNHA